MKQWAPWKVAVPFVIFCGVVMATWCANRQPLALVAAGLGLGMGIVWTVGAWRAGRRTRPRGREGPVREPSKSHGVVLCRGRLGGLFGSRGHVVIGKDAVFLARGSQPVCGEHLRLAEAMVVPVARRGEVDRYVYRAGAFSGGTLSLYSSTGVRRLWVADDEAMARILAVLSDDGCGECGHSRGC